MESLLVSTLSVAVAEFGDKTQLLALVLASRFRRPAAILAGILVATVLNHAVAAWFGATAVGWLPPAAARWVLAMSFLAVAAWMLVPDRLDEPSSAGSRRHGAFLTTVVCFFLAEMGDKTQVATVALAARYEAVLMVTAGTTLGMLAANLPAVLVGDRVATALPFGVIRLAAATLFAALGLLALAGVGVNSLLP